MASRLTLRRAARRIVALAVTTVLVCPTGVAAQAPAITGDGSLGTAVRRAGEAYTISGGTVRGNNLFHSFGLFNVPTGGSATFTGPSLIANILSRVTGGQRSTIDGLIRTRASMPNANFYLINPNGVMFTSGASLDVGGAVRVATSNNIMLTDGTLFSATPVPGERSRLTSAPPQTFGFLSSAPAAISVEGAQLAVDPGRTLSLVGGDVLITGGATLSAPGGLVQIGSVASPGNAVLSAPDLNLTVFAHLGQVSISDGAFVTAGSDTLPAGTVLIRSGRLVVDNAVLSASTFDLPGAALGIDLHATDSIVLRNGATVLTESFGAGEGAGISIVTGSLAITDGAGVETRAFGAGRSGNIAVEVRQADILNGKIRTSSSNSVAGDITITASDTLMLSGPTGEISTGTAALDFEILAGRISLTAGNVILGDQANIRSGSLLEQAGESVIIRARDSVVLSGLSGISSQAFAQNAGTVDISAPRLMMDGGFVNTSTLGVADAGRILVTADTVSLTNGAQIASSSQIVASGGAGSITINAKSVTITGVGPADGVGSITFTGDPRSGLFSNTDAGGAGGSILVATDNLVIGDNGVISARSAGTGVAGNIDLVIGDTLRMNGGAITTEALTADGGNISITTTGSLLHLTDSQITTSVRSGRGSGGNITIGSASHPIEFVVLNDSQIRADAFGGPGGNVGIFADVYLTSSSIVSASSALGVPGTINIQANVTDVSGGLTQLSESTLQASSLLRAACTARLAGGPSSSLVVSGREGLPPEPGAFMPSSLIAEASEPALSLFDDPDQGLIFPRTSLWSSATACSR